LTGDEIASEGDAWVGNYSLNSSHSKFVSSLGYCPQFDAIIGELTGKEMLKLFGSLRGIPSSTLNRVVDRWLRKMGKS